MTECLESVITNVSLRAKALTNSSHSMISINSSFKRSDVECFIFMNRTLVWSHENERIARDLLRSAVVLQFWNSSSSSVLPNDRRPRLSQSRDTIKRLKQFCFYCPYVGSRIALQLLSVETRESIQYLIHEYNEFGSYLPIGSPDSRLKQSV